MDYFQLMELIHQSTLRVCKEEGGIPIDLARGVKWDDADFYDFVHNTPAGAKKIGTYLYEKLRPLF